MGYLNKETVTVDAILTKRGRELLAQGKSAFQVTQFAVADDEIDYGLYDSAHPLGTEFYGSAIEAMPIVEATPDGTQNLKYKLVTFSRSLIEQVNVIPTVSLKGRVSLELKGLEQSDPITPETNAGTQAVPFDGESYGYTAILYDTAAATISATSIRNAPTPSPTSTSGVPNTAEVKVGLSFTITAKDVSQTINTVITFIGNQSGASITLPLTVSPRLK